MIKVLAIILYVIGVVICTGLIFHLMPDEFDYADTEDRVCAFMLSLVWPLCLLCIFVCAIFKLIIKPSIFIAGFFDKVRNKDGGERMDVYKKVPITKDDLKDIKGLSTKEMTKLFLDEMISSYQKTLADKGWDVYLIKDQKDEEDGKVYDSYIFRKIDPELNERHVVHIIFDSKEYDYHLNSFIQDFEHDWFPNKALSRAELYLFTRLAENYLAKLGLKEEEE